MELRITSFNDCLLNSGSNQEPLYTIKVGLQTERMVWFLRLFESTCERDIVDRYKIYTDHEKYIWYRCERMFISFMFTHVADLLVCWCLNLYLYLWFYIDVYSLKTWHALLKMIQPFKTSSPRLRCPYTYVYIHLQR